MSFEKRYVGGPDGILHEEDLTPEMKAKLNAPKPRSEDGKPIFYGDADGVLGTKSPDTKQMEDFRETLKRRAEDNAK